MALLASDAALENQTEVTAVGVGQGGKEALAPAPAPPSPLTPDLPPGHPAEVPRAQRQRH